MTPDCIEYLYKKYRSSMKPLGIEIMPRRVFKVFIEQAQTLQQGEQRLEQFVEELMHKLIEDFKSSMLVLDEDVLVRSNSKSVSVGSASGISTSVDLDIAGIPDITDPIDIANGIHISMGLDSSSPNTSMSTGDSYPHDL